MSKFILTAGLFIIACAAAFAQKTSGIIYYQQTIEFKPRNSSNGQAPANAMMPRTITNKYEIDFNPEGAKFQKTIDEEPIGGSGGDGGGAPRMMTFGGMGGGDKEILYTGDKVTESFQLDGEAVLLEGKLGSQSAEVTKTDEIKKIAGFDCHKATIVGKNGSTTIWYTTALPLKASPVPAFWTEGVVLGLETDRMKFYATSVEYLKIKSSDLALPKKARLISEEEYTQKREAERKKMEERIKQLGGGNGGNVIIERN